MQPELAKQLAYYSSGPGLGTYGPKGWSCFGTYGSDGTSLYISPQPINRGQLVSGDSGGISGSAIQLSTSSGGTSGRFEVAKAIARLFPAHKSFVDNVISEGIEPASSFPTGPYPSDQMEYLSDEAVEFVTPGGTEGLGTDSRLEKDADPIKGIVFLSGQDTDLSELCVRIPASQSELERLIITQFETEERVTPLTSTKNNKPTADSRQPSKKDPALPLTSSPRSSTEVSTPSTGLGLVGVLLIVLAFLVYWLPTIIAFRRKTINKRGVVVVNLFLGWTFIGWVVALAMAYGGVVQQDPISSVVIYAQNVYPAQGAPTYGLRDDKTIQGLPSPDTRTLE